MPLYDSDTGMLFIAGKVCFAFTFMFLNIVKQHCLADGSITGSIT